MNIPSIGQSRGKIFKAITERISSKLKGWKERLLSAAGREIMIKSVVQAIPTYTMGLFTDPDYLPADIQTMVSKFGWVKLVSAEKYIGCLGIVYVLRKRLGAWAFGI